MILDHKSRLNLKKSDQKENSPNPKTATPVKNLSGL